MLKLKKIKSDASWGEVVDAINDNNSAINTEAETLKFANVDWGEDVVFDLVDGSDLVPNATLQHNTCYLFGEVEELNITLDSDASDFVKVYMFQFHSGATPTKLSVPSEVKWANDPIIRANRVYQVTIIDGYATYREFLFNTAEMPTTEIWYTSSDGLAVEPYATNVFGATYESSTYERGKGIMTFASEVTKIGTSAFSGKTTLTSATPPSSVKEIGNNAFRGCTALTKPVIPYGVTTLGAYAFYQCSALKSIVIPDSVTKLGATGCFGYCSSLESVRLSKNIQEIPYSCFSSCVSLKSIEIPYGVTTIGVQAFATCNSLKNVVVPDSVTIIKNDAFRWSANIETVVLYENLETIESFAFQNCSSLKSVNIPSSVTTMGGYAFQSDNMLERVDITDLSAWCRIEFRNRYSTPLGFANAKLYLNDELLSNFVTPSDISELKAYVFLGNNSFLKSVTITSNITSIGNMAFYNRYGLTSVTFESTTPPTLGTDVFTNTNASLQLRVPSSAVETYKAAYPDYADKIVGY